MSSAKKQQNESALVCAARQGDREAIVRLLESNWQWLKGLAYNLLGNADDVDEVMQNICILVIQKVGTLREPERFKQWLTTVARHAVLAYRQQRSRKPIQLDDLLFAQQQAAENESAVDKLDREETHEKIMEAVRALPEKYGEVFIMKYVDDLTYNQIGEILNIPVTTVQIRLVRARRMLLNHLTGRPNDKVPRT
jgi:RNA polymerase sigma-70 factor (ECF subfamily)